MLDIATKMKELLEIEVFFGKAGDIIPISYIDETCWQSPDYSRDFPEDENRPDLVGYDGQPTYKVKLAGTSESGLEYFYPSDEVLTWENIAKEDFKGSRLYLRLKEDWAGISLGNSPSNSFGTVETTTYLNHEVGYSGAESLFDESYGMFHGWEDHIVDLAKNLSVAEIERQANDNRYFGENGSMQPNYANLVLVIDMHFESDRDWETGVEGGYMVVEDIGVLDFSKLETIKLPSTEQPTTHEL